MSLLPLFADGAGRTSADPLELTGPTPEVDLHAVALQLSLPALLGEFVPACPWKGVTRLAARLPEPVLEPLPEAFTQSVQALTSSADRIGVLVSGGLDSLAVLVAAQQAAEGRPVIAFTTNLIDDNGHGAAAVVSRLLADLALPASLMVLHPGHDRAVPPWTPAGPRLDALPEINAAAAAKAAELQIDVLLSGDGADELLGVPRFATGAVATRRGPLAAARYLSDVAASGPGLLGEAAAAVSRLLPPPARARTYWAANWPEWCDPVAPAVLAQPYREAATAWAREWAQDQISAHAIAGRSWAQADAHDAVFPREVIPSAGPVPFASPFLHKKFLTAALALPLGDRYHPNLPSAYQRCKAQVVRLLPRSALSALPARKQYFSRALSAHSTAGRAAPQCLRAGLLDPVALAAERDPAVLLTVAAIERWLTGARRATAGPAGAGSATGGG